MNCLEILNLIAIVIIPIVTVLIGHYLQNRSEKRKDKMNIFKVLMTSRIYGWTVESVHALNLIDVIFVKDRDVREAWKKLFDAYSTNDQSKPMIEKRKQLMYKLLEEMANCLGYKNQITWETIQNPYVPQGMIDMWNSQAKNQQYYSEFLATLNKSFPGKDTKK